MSSGDNLKSLTCQEDINMDFGTLQNCRDYIMSGKFDVGDLSDFGVKVMMGCYGKFDVGDLSDFGVKVMMGCYDHLQDLNTPFNLFIEDLYSNVDAHNEPSIFDFACKKNTNFLE